MYVSSDAFIHYAVCCSVLQCVAVCCSVLQCVAVCCKYWLSCMRHVTHSFMQKDPYIYDMTLIYLSHNSFIYTKWFNGILHDSASCLMLIPSFSVMYTCIHVYMYTCIHLLMYTCFSCHCVVYMYTCRIYEGVMSCASMSFIAHVHNTLTFQRYGVAMISRLLQIKVSFAEYRFFNRSLLQKSLKILRSQLIVATPYVCNTEACRRHICVL